MDTPAPNKNSDWHAQSHEVVCQQFATTRQGLAEQEAKLRLQRHGPNALPNADQASWWQRLLAQFHNVLIYVLLASACISAALAHYVDAAVILAVVLVNAIVGLIQEGKAENALRAIMSMTRTHTMVIRDSALCEIDSTLLVPGDVVWLQAGDRVPADIHLFDVKELRCDESALTGEAQPVSKHAAISAANTPLAERTNMAYMGTMTTYGVAYGVVVATGMATEIGKISDMVKGVELPQTPLQRQLGQFARQLTMAILVVCALTVALGMLLHQYALGDMFQAAIGIAVSAIPEGLPAIVTIALAIGVQRMAARNALVRRLPAVEVLGSVDVICSDKTGTLTANAMTAREVFTAEHGYRITGEGYCPEGSITTRDGDHVGAPGQNGCFTRAGEIAMLCNDARIAEESDTWALHGDPTEGALLTLAKKHGLNELSLRELWPRIDLLPFESERRYMATLHHNGEGHVRLMVKGAPERLLQFAEKALSSVGEKALDRATWQAEIDDFARRGMRVMALAYRDFSQRPDVLAHEDAERDLVMVALVGISDPPRPEAISSINDCHAAGIRVKMITGDNPVTAAAIGRELGLNTASVMTGAELDALSPEALKTAAEQCDVFARTSPANKLQLVEALQNQRHVVAMTGDGVNDAPALRKADIGVAMGQKGTDAARDAAAFVLTNDNFSTIAKAVAEGRAVYDNIVKSIIFILPTSLAESLVIFCAIMLGWTMPVTPAQVLWINMITTVTLALVLAFEQPEADVMSRPPRPYGEGLFSLDLVIRMVLVGGLGAVIVFGLFAYYQANGASLEMARTVAVNALVMVEVFYLFNCRFLHQSIFGRHFFRGFAVTCWALLAIVLVQGVFSYLPVSQQVFGLASMTLIDWGIVVLCSAPVLLLVEAEKRVQRQYASGRIAMQQALS